MLAQLIVILTLSSGAMLWVIYAMPKTLAGTLGLMAFCQSLFIRCAEYGGFLKLLAFWGAALLVFSGLAYAAIAAVISLIRARKAIKSLPIKDGGTSIVLINDSAISTAFTSGLFSPRIYISKGLIERLDRDELRGVFFHELHHKRRFDPLRFFLMNFLKHAFFYLPAAGCLAGRTRVRKELEADDAAVNAMKETLGLAGALLKAEDFNASAFTPGATHLTGGKDRPYATVEARVKRLIEGIQVKPLAPRPAAMTASIIIAAFVTLSFIGSFNPTISQACTPKHCSVHANKLGKDCKKHCSRSKHGHHVH